MSGGLAGPPRAPPRGAPQHRVGKNVCAVHQHLHRPAPSTPEASQRKRPAASRGGGRPCLLPTGCVHALHSFPTGHGTAHHFRWTPLEPSPGPHRNPPTASPLRGPPTAAPAAPLPPPRTPTRRTARWRHRRTALRRHTAPHTALPATPAGHTDGTSPARLHLEPGRRAQHPANTHGAPAGARTLITHPRSRACTASPWRPRPFARPAS